MNLRDSHFGEFDQRLEQMLSRLTPEFRKVLVLRELEGRKLTEIAELLHVPLLVVRKRLHSARRELRQLLQQEAE